MDMNGIPLKPAHFLKYLPNIPARGSPYTKRELVDWVVKRHQKVGGVVVANPMSQAKKSLVRLVDNGTFEHVGNGLYRKLGDAGAHRIDESLMARDHASAPSEEPESQAVQSEVEVGSGCNTIYGWYYPSYRTLAELQGRDTWPIKVGRSDVHPKTRMISSSGFSPEKPILAFVHNVDDSENCEKYYHAILSAQGKNIDDAQGSEWFMTNLAELRDHAEQFEARILQANGGATND